MYYEQLFTKNIVSYSLLPEEISNPLIDMLVYGISKKMGNSGALNLPLPESVESGGGPPASQWVLVGVIGSSELGTPDRLMKVETLKQKKPEHGETVLTFFSS